MFIRYLIFGFLFTLFMIFYYRRDGQTKQKYELYWAVIGPLIWPVQFLKLIIDLIKMK